MPQDAFTEKTGALAAEVLALSRNTLLVHLRFLGAALGRLAAEEAKGLPAGLETDGRVLYYDPGTLLRAYQAGRGVPARDLLHCVLHCVLRHFSAPGDAAPELWDLACDIAAEHMITELGLPALSAPREARQRKACARLREAGVPLTAEKLYRYYLPQCLSKEELGVLRAAFCADGHRLWYERDAAEAGTENVWREISQRMQVELETFARRRGGAALMLGLREANRTVPDYAGFLRKFAARGEPMRLDADEFDYGLYSYGLQLYGGSVPLIEPVEYRETRRVRDFAVVTAFSGAFPAETARRLLETTRAQLTASETASSKVALHVLPGEADARGAFRAVDALLRRGELKNLKGLLFLTDAIAAFPAAMPAYPAAFVFVNDDYSVPEVPPWAIRTVLQRDEI